MNRGIVSAIVGFVVLAAVAGVYRPVRARIREVAADFKLISADTGDIMSSAIYQRFALRRKAVESMQAALFRVARAESVAVTQLGRPEANNLAPYGFTNTDPGNLIYLRLQGDRWTAQAKNIHTSMSCSLTAVVVDTSASTWIYRPGTPVCADST